MVTTQDASIGVATESTYKTGVTTTRSKVMSSIRQVDAPSRNVSPTRDS